MARVAKVGQFDSLLQITSGACNSECVLESPEVSKRNRSRKVYEKSVASVSVPVTLE